MAAIIILSIITLSVVVLLVVTFTKLIRYDANRNAEIPTSIKQHDIPAIKQEQLNQINKVVLTRAQARQLKRDALKNPVLKKYVK